MHRLIVTRRFGFGSEWDPDSVGSVDHDLGKLVLKKWEMKKFHIHELSEGLCSSPWALEGLEVLDPDPVRFGIQKSLDPDADSVKCLDSDSVNLDPKHSLRNSSSFLFT